MPEVWISHSAGPRNSSEFHKLLRSKPKNLAISLINKGLNPRGLSGVNNDVIVHSEGNGNRYFAPVFYLRPSQFFERLIS